MNAVCISECVQHYWWLLQTVNTENDFINNFIDGIKKTNPHKSPEFKKL